MGLGNANLHLYLELEKIPHLPLQTQAAGMELHKIKGSRLTSALHHLSEVTVPSLNIWDASEWMPQVTRVTIETYIT